MTAVATDLAWYVFGVVPAADAERLEARIVEARGLAALVAAVPLSEFGADVLPERLNDREWLERQAREHVEVLQAACAAATVVPFRFGTIYRELDDVRAMLDARRAELAASLERVRGKVEVGVKAWAAPLEERAAAAASGGDYLRRQLAARRAAESASASLADAAAAAHERLLRHAVEGVANRPQPPELTGRREPMILNGAYLVTSAEAVRAEVESLSADHAGAGITFEATGPWPPYNFVDERREQ